MSDFAMMFAKDLGRKYLLPLYQHRVARHIAFWLLYYVTFSLLWAREGNYFASFYLEFVLLPARLIAVYAVLNWLIPHYLLQRNYQQFVPLYIATLTACALLHCVSDYFFYQGLLLNEQGPLLTLSGLGRSVMLINSTVLFLSAIKIFQLYLIEVNKNGEATPRHLALKSNRRTYIVSPLEIHYIEGMGNYANYHMKDGRKIVVYTSIKAALTELPEGFIRVHRSYIVNSGHIESFNQDCVFIAGEEIPRSKHIADTDLLPELI
ncbi:LytR/AlgR family response regulator transcription factor [Pseudoteredinibacter isoporae]|uniref:LytR/AlgR family response regulator transcription factor n=1 Tax=Pseudoteredinibacter isoporae TaxID=570281 RepID=UPI00310519C1